MTDVIVILAVLAVLGAAAAYIVKAKKRGEKCIGCPHAKECAKKAGHCAGCHDERP